MELWNLIAKHLSDKLSAEEEKKLADWIKDSHENEKNFKEIEKLWNVLGKLNKEYTPDTEKAWEKLKAKIKSSSNTKVIPILHRNWLSIAAAILAIAVLGTVLKYMFSHSEIHPAKNIGLVKVITSDSMEIFYLPDSSKIFLNKNSSISYAKDFDDTARITYLVGEAYFEVRKNGNPFFVYAGGEQVRVLGTSFNVKANDDDVEVVVLEGKVAFSEQGSSPSSAVTLEKDDKITFNRKNKEYTKRKSNNEDFWWGKLNLEKGMKKFFNKVKKEFRKK